MRCSHLFIHYFQLESDDLDNINRINKPNFTFKLY